MLEDAEVARCSADSRPHNLNAEWEQARRVACESLCCGGGGGHDGVESVLVRRRIDECTLGFDDACEEASLVCSLLFDVRRGSLGFSAG